MNFFLYCLGVGIIFMMAFIGRIPATPHKNILLETTLPAEKLNNPQVLKITQTYKQRLWQLAILLALVSLPLLFLTYDSLVMIYFLVVLFGTIGCYYYLQIVYIRKMTALKMNQNWYLPTRPLLIDTKLIIQKNRKLVSIWWFLPSTLLSFFGMIYTVSIVGWSDFLWIPSLIALIMNALFLLFYSFIANFPVKPVTNDETINQQVNDTMRHHWSFLMVLSAAVFSPLALLPVLTLRLSYTSFVGSSIMYALVILGFVFFTFWYLLSARKKEDHFIAQAKEYRYTDDDRYWKYGIYINPEDHRLFLPDRIGMNITLNLGRLGGKIMMAGLVIVIVCVSSIALIPMVISDFSSDPFQLTSTDQGITLRAPLSKEQTIPWTSIESVELVDHLSEDAFRIYGTATENYLTGEFQIGDRPAYLLVYRKETPILKIRTKQKDYYYTNKDKAVTKKDFTAIEQHHKK